MSESNIFLDRSKLSARYIPNELHHREKEMSLLLTMFKDSYIKPDAFLFSTPQIIGRSGIGKTSTIIKFSNMLESEFTRAGLTLKVAYINLKLQGGNKYAVYRFLLEKIAPELPSQGLSAEEMLRYLLSYLYENKLYTLIILDEIEFLLRSNKDSGIIYDFTRLNEFDLSKHCNVIGVIFIARSTDFHDKIDSSELSTLGRIPIEFLPYSVEQISDILVTRSSESFNPKVVGTDIIDEVSLITTSSQVGGDVRYALDLLLYAGNLAETNGSDRITLEQIRKVHGYNRPSITIEDLKELPKSYLLTIMAILKVQSKRKKQYIELKEIRTFALELADEYKVKKFEFEDCMNDLLERKIIEMKSLKEIGMNITSLVELEPLLEQQINKK
ncbi:MAG: Cdc6/Cdc18 family protein [Nitrososphaerota archaeon]|nr:AAA family ATPase [Nitrososphaeraceae archaeon]HEX5673169.1 AAA family ATPase [Nitrososphaeraceae archaeon]